MTLNFGRNYLYTWGQDQPERWKNSLAGIACNSARAKTWTLTTKICGTGTDWRTTVRTACTSTETESKQNMDEQRTLAATTLIRKLQWINKNPASELRKGNNCWTTPGTLWPFGAQENMKNNELQGDQQRCTKKAHEKGWSTCEARLRIWLE